MFVIVRGHRLPIGLLLPATIIHYYCTATLRKKNRFCHIQKRCQKRGWWGTLWKKSQLAKTYTVVVVDNFTVLQLYYCYTVLYCRKCCDCLTPYFEKSSCGIILLEHDSGFTHSLCAATYCDRTKGCCCVRTQRRYLPHCCSRRLGYRMAVSLSTPSFSQNYYRYISHTVQ